ncbi:MAG TPA: DUF5752 family protein [Candidatus Acidoferrales bacterium]|nr:DUF5752 family protein [Candidatus Acidoferrales bacterium]
MLPTSYSSDFAQWTMAACNENELAEQLGAIDVRAFVDLEDLRSEPGLGIIFQAG